MSDDRIELPAMPGWHVSQDRECIWHLFRDQKWAAAFVNEEDARAFAEAQQRAAPAMEFPRASEIDNKSGWKIDTKYMRDLQRAVREQDWSAPDWEIIEIILLKVEKDLARLTPERPALPDREVTDTMVEKAIDAFSNTGPRVILDSQPVMSFQSILRRMRAALEAALAQPDPQPKAEAGQVEATDEPFWMVEDSGNHLWIGPARRDGFKVDRVVTCIELEPYTDKARAQRRADAELIVRAINTLPRDTHPSTASSGQGGETQL